MELCDVAINIFGKPYQTALSLLSLLRYSSQHISTIWLQFEPVGSSFDETSPYAIAYYLKQELKKPCQIFQPELWFDCDAPELSRLNDPTYRHGLRYTYAFENSNCRLLFLTHNDVLFHKDLLGELITKLGTAFAIGHLGQCWNCPASLPNLTKQVLGREACKPTNYLDFHLNASELKALYAEGLRQKILRRNYGESYADETGSVWPLPECRVNEWACLIDLEKTRPLTLPEGEVLPIGVYLPCGRHNLDIGVAWFRGMHKLGLHAKHYPCNSYLTHWVGTGHKSKLRYLQGEDRAKKILSKHFPEYLAWLAANKS
ncbi:MAG: hypothetical protein IJS50_01790 [Desulfovibrio sp.]|nr:hypothetical protein [Desulfovibrio sp.]